MTTFARLLRLPALPGYGRGEEPEWTVLLTLAIALVLGSLVEVAVVGRTAPVSAGDVSLAVPASWVAARQADVMLAAAASGAPTSPRVAVRSIAKADLAADPAAPVGEAGSAWALRLGERYPSAFQLVRRSADRVSGREAQTIEYVYLERTSGGAPVLLRATDTLVASGDRYLVLTFAAPEARFDELTTGWFPLFRSLRSDLLASWRFP